jgi:hypothetical protein
VRDLSCRAHDVWTVKKVLNADSTLYVRAGDGRFERQQGSTAGAAQTAPPSLLDADEPLAVPLRAGHSVARREEAHSALPGELAMVLSRQREPDAFVVIGRRRDGSVLRSDEVTALRGTPESVGVEWQAVRREALQQDRVRAYDPASRVSGTDPTPRWRRVASCHCGQAPSAAMDRVQLSPGLGPGAPSDGIAGRGAAGPTWNTGPPV